MFKPIKSEHLIRLGLYTVNAADIIQNALHMMDDMKFGDFLEPTPFIAEHGTFGLENHTAFVIVLSNGELAIEAFDETQTAFRHGRPRISNEEAFEVIKNCVTALVSINEAFLADSKNAIFDNRDLDRKPGDAHKKSMEKTVRDGKLLLKFLNKEELTEEEQKIIVGRPLNPFEQSQLKELTDLMATEIANHKKVSARGKIRTYLKKVQGED